MSTSFFSPLTSLMTDGSTKGARRRMMLASMLSQGAGQEPPRSPFAGVMQGLQGGIGNGLMIAEMARDFGDWDQPGGVTNPGAVKTTPPMYGSSAATEQGRIPGQDFGAPSSVRPESGSFWGGGSYGDLSKAGSTSPLSYSFNSLGQGIQNFGYGVGNWFGGLW